VHSRATDTRSEDRPAGQAPRHVGSPVARMSGKTPQLRVPGWRPSGEQTVLGAENNRSSFVTTDRYKHGGYDAPTEPRMSPEVPVMSQNGWQGPSMEDRKIFGDAAIHHAVE
jgi:hypothetical protein